MENISIDDLTERAELLGYINKLEADSSWSSLEDLQERCGLLD